MLGRRGPFLRRGAGAPAARAAGADGGPSGQPEPTRARMARRQPRGRPAPQQRSPPVLARRPATAHQQAQDDPVVSPTEDLQGAAGQEGIVMHARTVDGQATLVTQSVVASDFDQADGGKGADQDLGQDVPEKVEIPSRRAEEAMIATVVTVVGRAAGLNEFGDEAIAEGQAPATHEAAKGLKAGLGEDVTKLL